MVTKTLSHQEALDRARSNRVYLMVLFGFAIVGILGDLRYLEGSSVDFVWIFLDLMTIFFSYLLVRTCFASYAVLVFATKLGAMGLHFLRPLDENQITSLVVYGAAGAVLYFFAFLACMRIKRYLFSIPVALGDK